MTVAPARAAEAIERCVGGFIDLYPGEVSERLESENLERVAVFIREQSPTRAATLLERLTPETASGVLERLDDETARALVPTLDPARAAILISRLDTPDRERMLALLDASLAGEIGSLASYPPDTAGRLMDSRVTTFRPDTPAGDALERLRGTGRRGVTDVCLVDEHGRLAGVVPIQALATAEPDEPLDSLVPRAPIFVEAMAAREDVVEMLTTRRLTSLPVVDADGRLVGIIRHDALRTAVQEDATADLQTMVGASSQERALSPVRFAVRKRLPWLQINLATAFLAASVVGLFEATIAQFTALAVLLPVVAGQSGNTGAQALAVTMRGLALREIRLRHALKVGVKETTVGFVNGIAVAVVTSLGVFVWSRSIGLCLVIGLAMVISMIVAGMSGAAIPMVLTSLKQDPAQSSSIILTTVTDVVGFFSFLGLATVLSALL